MFKLAFTTLPADRFSTPVSRSLFLALGLAALLAACAATPSPRATDALPSSNMQETTDPAEVSASVARFDPACSGLGDDPGGGSDGGMTSEQPKTVNVRLATFNVAMGLSEEGELSRALYQDDDERLRSLARIIQEVRPDILLLNEFDYDPGTDAPGLLNANYLGRSQGENPAIDYPYSFRAEVNTGVGSGLDLNGNGVLLEPEDAWGFGTFPGQYGMLVLSRFPIGVENSRSFQRFPWSGLPDARAPFNPDGSPYYSEEIWRELRLSSKSHWDLSIDIGGRPLHFLAFHPTPPVFDGPEDRNGMRNFDEIRFWVEYLDAAPGSSLIDDQGRRGGLAAGEPFVIAGDFNADPVDGDSVPGAAAQLLRHPWIDSACLPKSEGGSEAAIAQGGVNAQQRGDAATDTADFNDTFTGNLRIDYILPAAGLAVTACGVYWPAENEPGHAWTGFSDHRLVWVDVLW